jgi:hypothetical protein
MSQQKWLNCRLQDLAAQLARQGHGVSPAVISRLLRARDYHLRGNTKQVSSRQVPERDEQFHYLRAQRAAHLATGQPVISVDTKKKELIGNFKNAGRIWCQQAERVNVHDFPAEAVGRAVPYGIYDLAHNCGTVYLGQSGDTPAFAVDNIAHWCRTELPERYTQVPVTRLLIEADSGGSNSARSRVWKHQLQGKVADAFGLSVTVCHYPTGTSKWNPIEHRLFSEISKTWAGCPLRSFELAQHYIATTSTVTGLSVRVHLVTVEYKTGLQVSAAEMAALLLQPHLICTQWNYTIYPRTCLLGF